MKRIFLDTNILIDYIDNRAGADNAEQIFACGFSGEALLFASALSFANIAYIIKRLTQEEKYDALSQMANVVEIVDLRKQEVIAAIAQPVKDFEDMLQYHAAMAANCSHIITRNEQHFPKNGIMVLSPTVFLQSPLAE